MSILFGALGISAIAGFCYYQNNGITISKYKIDLNIKNKIRIVQLSDLHGKEFGRDNYKLFKKIENIKPDLIFATGDMIDSNLKNLDEIIGFLGELNKISKVIYISGNNEGRTEKLEYIFSELKEKNVVVLKNQIFSLYVKGEKVNILGMFERPSRGTYSPLAKVSDKYLYRCARKLFERLEELEGLKIVLSHYPEKFVEEYSKYKFDLMFAGHAHGGQFRIPFVGGVIAPGQGLFPKYTSGVHGEDNKLVISRGLGNSGVPLRIFNRPEIVVVEVG